MKWTTMKFPLVVKDATGGHKKIQKKEYLLEGSIPVIDQGQGLVAGFTDDETYLLNNNLPVILFGDHTRVFKYVDFPFALGADGIKVLQPNNQLDAKFLYFYLMSIKIPSRGYSRHFKFLKEISISLPPLSEQRRIVEILDQADELRKKRAEADAKAEKILPALFYKMFGDPATNSKGWEVIPLGKLSIGKPQYGANAKAIDWKKGKPRYVRITDVENSGSLSSKDIKTVDLHEWDPYKLEYGDLLFARSGATVGKSYLYQPEDGLCVFAGYLIRFKIDFNKIDPFVVFSFTQLPCYKAWVKSKQRTHGQPNINAQEYSSLLIPNPKKELQQAFVKTVLEIRKARKMIDQAKIKIELLYTTILHKAFSGDLTAKWREAHMKELLAEMEEQTKVLKDSPKAN